MISTQYLFEDLRSEEKLTVSQLEKEAAKLLPTLMNTVGGNLQQIFPAMTNKSEADYVKSFDRKISNLNVNVYDNIMGVLPTGYTIPAAQGKIPAQLVMLSN